jgi:hypothetical protein
MSEQPDQLEALPATLEDFTALGLGPVRRKFIIASLLAVGTAGVPLPALAKVVRARRKDVRFLTPARFAVLDALAETIMPRTDTPGARDALVPQRFDALLQNWASAETKAKFTAMIDAAEAAARAAGASGLAALPAAKQLEVVSAFDRAKFADASYRKFKNLILSLYYLSEPGATQELRYEHVPGAWEPNIPVTPDTRAWAVDVSV